MALTGIRLQLRRPSAFVPLVLSAAALAMVVGHFAIYGIAHEADEGTPAHVFQLLMIMQAPIIATFVVRGLDKAPVTTLQVLACQFVAAGAAILSALYLT